jgi:ParB-like chromosome segregation protein Spo0J
MQIQSPPWRFGAPGSTLPGTALVFKRTNLRFDEPMTHAIQVMARKDRKSRIDAELKSSTRTMPFKFREKMRDLPHVRVPIGVPVYRMKNGRTEAEQDDYLLKHSSLPTDFFNAGEENVDAQRIQHELLLVMSHDNKRPIYDTLKKSAQQEEPLLLTASGVVVNGNRRMAAMRDLVASEPGAFGTFQFIDALVLPAEANERDLDEIEVRLQMMVETKQEYSWINQRLKMRRLMEEHGLSEKEIAKHMNYAKASTVNREIRELALVEEYLERYRGVARTNYTLFVKGAQIFKEIAQRVTNKQGTSLELAKGIAFTMVKGSKEITDRVYEYRDSFGEDLDRVVERLVLDLNIPINAAKAISVDESDPLSGLDSSTPPHVEELLRRLNDPTQAEDLTPRITTIQDSINRGKSDDDKRAQAMMELRKIATNLSGVDLAELDPRHYKDTRVALESCTTRIAHLSSQLEKLGG